MSTVSIIGLVCGIVALLFSAVAMALVKHLGHILKETNRKYTALLRIILLIERGEADSARYDEKTDTWQAVLNR